MKPPATARTGRREVFGVKAAGAVHHLAEKNGEGGAQAAHHHHLDQRQGGEDGKAGDGIGRGRDAQVSGQQKAGEGGEKGRTRAAYWMIPTCTTSRAKMAAVRGGAEEGGEGGRHAADREHPSLLRLHAQPVGDLVGDGGAQLEGGPLPAGGSRHQMGDDGGEKDEGGGAQLHGFMLPDGHQHQIRAAVLLHPAGAVEKDDGQPAYRQQKDEAGVGLAQLGDKVDAVVKGDAHDPHQQPDHHGKDGPAQKIQKIQGLGSSSSAGSSWRSHLPNSDGTRASTAPGPSAYPARSGHARILDSPQYSIIKRGFELYSEKF